MHTSPDRCKAPSLTRRAQSGVLAFFRLSGVVLHLAYAVLLASIFPALSSDTRRIIIRRWSRNLLKILHVSLDVQGSFEAGTLPGRLLLANHVSWLDMVAMNAVFPASFVAKSEVRSWPLLGWLCERVGAIFIRRDIRRDTARANRVIAEALMQGECVGLFPEGTSTDGTSTGHFHSSLLQGAIDAMSAICPVALRYHNGAGAVCRDAAFVGDMSFIRSLWNVMCSRSLHITLYYLPPLPAEGMNRRLLAAGAQKAVQEVLGNFSPDHAAQPSPDHAVGAPEADTPAEWHPPPEAPIYVNNSSDVIIS
jgi:1-acyl-sn-glycerol-3-phosphate acyltransferase